MTVLYRPYWDLYAGIERWQPILLLPWLLLSATGVTRPSSASSASSATSAFSATSSTSASSATSSTSSTTSATSATSASSATSAIAPVPNLQIEMALQLVEICMQTWKTDN